MGNPIRALAVNKSSTGTQPPGRSVRPRSAGAWRRCLARNLLTVTMRRSIAPSFSGIGHKRKEARGGHAPPRAVVRFAGPCVNPEGRRAAGALVPCPDLRKPGVEEICVHAEEDTSVR